MHSSCLFSLKCPAVERPFCITRNGNEGERGESWINTILTALHIFFLVFHSWIKKCLKRTTKQAKHCCIPVCLFSRYLGLKWCWLEIALEVTKLNYFNWATLYIFRSIDTTFQRLANLVSDLPFCNSWIWQFKIHAVTVKVNVWRPVKVTGAEKPQLNHCINNLSTYTGCLNTILLDGSESEKDFLVFLRSLQKKIVERFWDIESPTNLKFQGLLRFVSLAC